MRFKKILIFFLIIIFAGALTYLVLGARNEQADVSKRMLQLQAQARPYERELEQLKKEIRDFTDEVVETSSPQYGRVEIAFQPVSSENISWIRDMSKEYFFDPVIVLDCTLEEETLSHIIYYLKRYPYEVVFTASPVTEETLQLVEKVREELFADGEAIDTGVFLLSGSDDTEDNLDFLAENGFTRCMRFINDYASEVMENGLVCLGYGNINSRNVALKNTLQSAALEKHSIMLVFNLSIWENNSANNKIIDSYIDTVYSCTGDGTLLFSSLDNAFEDALKYSMQLESSNAESESFLSEKQARIDELEKIIADIYYGDN